MSLPFALTSSSHPPDDRIGGNPLNPVGSAAHCRNTAEQYMPVSGVHSTVAGAVPQMHVVDVVCLIDVS